MTDFFNEITGGVTALLSSAVASLLLGVLIRKAGQQPAVFKDGVHYLSPGPILVSIGGVFAVAGLSIGFVLVDSASASPILAPPTDITAVALMYGALVPLLLGCLWCVALLWFERMTFDASGITRTSPLGDWTVPWDDISCFRRTWYGSPVLETRCGRRRHLNEGLQGFHDLLAEAARRRITVTALDDE